MAIIILLNSPEIKKIKTIFLHFHQSCGKDVKIIEERIDVLVILSLSTLHYLLTHMDDALGM